MADLVKETKCPVIYNNMLNEKIYVEIKTRICVTQFIFVKSNAERRIHINTNSIKIQHDNIQLPSLVFYIDTMELIPTTCHGLHINKSCELHLRMKIRQRDAETIKAEIANPTSISSDGLLRKFDNFQSCICKMCGEDIIKTKRKFKRVLSLPSDNWQDNTDSWFCHNHGNGKQNGVGKNTSLLPKESDCFVGDNFFMVNEESLKHGIETIGNHSNQVRCRRCRFLIGKAVTSPGKTEDKDAKMVVKLYNHKLKINHSITNSRNPNDSCERDADYFYCSYIMSQSTSYTSFRFVLESDDRQPYALLWLLETTTEVLHLDASRNESPHTPQPIAKILYISCMKGSNKQLFSTWCKDLTVHSITFHDDMCLELLNLLVKSTLKLPVSLQQLDGFQVGYLHRPS
ncbi:unnamed protein product [Owenia fusiformis]|uniref:E3 ubiquitin-protein ligase E3D n=1 Tax=Owenia fusiformis TaxID=6347 RepID=A0A8J1Y3S0_OWEFU|nr:unnamed protein product [Owenia fusiformis]